MSLLKNSRLYYHLPLIILLALNIFVAVMTADDYGESWDEVFSFEYSESSLSNYSYWVDSEFTMEFPNTYIRYYGPAYFMASNLGIRLAQLVQPTLSQITAWHFFHFLTFQVAILSLYLICGMLFKRWTTFGITLLFSTQPVLWGHAFINPKDMPLMAFFTASLAAGLLMTNRISKEINPPESESISFKEIMLSDWAQISDKNKTLFLRLFAIWLLSVYVLVITSSAGIKTLLTDWVSLAYSAEPGSTLNLWFSRIGTNADTISVESYIAKAHALWDLVVRNYTFAGIILLALAPLHQMPQLRKWLFEDFNRKFFKRTINYLKHPAVLTAGILLGLATAIRVAAPFAAVLVSIYILHRFGRRGLPLIFSYGLISLVVVYLTWPYLWTDPVRQLIESVQLMSKFPWNGLVLFNGTLFKPVELPNSYLPTLFSIQFTEPLVVLFLISAAVLFLRLILKKERNILSLLVLIWLFLPLSFAAFSNPVMFDNFRHFLWLIPAIFILSGFGLEFILSKINAAQLKAGLIGLIVLPGILAGIALHPYQYIYYNTYIGGVQGAQDNFNLDYWATSYREAAGYINEVAPTGSRVLVWGPAHLVQHISRTDLIVEPAFSTTYDQKTGYDYTILLADSPKIESTYPEAPIIFSATIQDVPLSVVLQTRCTHSNPCP